MNMKPILTSLSDEDFAKMLAAACNRRERFYLEMGRRDPGFEYHIDLPREDGSCQPWNEFLADLDE